MPGCPLGIQSRLQDHHGSSLVHDPALPAPGNPGFPKRPMSTDRGQSLVHEPDGQGVHAPRNRLSVLADRNRSSALPARKTERQTDHDF